MNKLTVSSPNQEYPVYASRGALSELGGLMRQVGLSGKAALITNDVLQPMYAVAAIESLCAAGFEPTLCTIPEGERHKTLQDAAVLYDRLIEAGLDRSSAVVALGGGVVGDLAGFVAATYLRGVPFVQVPTTLLAMVDSSLGGKVAVDHPRGKNLIGAFHQPRLVVTDPALLGTLPESEFRSGMAEVIKHGIIASPDLFETLENEGADRIDWIVEQAIRVKVEIIQEDPYERGRRAVLNLGHTYGHAFEAVSGFQLRHGEAVGIGLLAAARTARAMELCTGSLEVRIARVLERFGLPTRAGTYPIASVREAMNTDKKRRSGRLRFVLPRDIGVVETRDDVPEQVVLLVLESLADGDPLQR